MNIMRTVIMVVAAAAFSVTAMAEETLNKVRDHALTATTAITAGGVGAVVAGATKNPAKGVAAATATATAVRPILDKTTKKAGEALGDATYKLLNKKN